MTDAIKILKEEHQNILKVVGALLTECAELESGKKLDKDFFTKVINFIREYADKFHHAKEEDILFIKMCENPEQMHCDPTQQMVHEHVLGRNFVKGMEEGIKKEDARMVIDNSLGYANLIQEHIFKEDNILYPMAENGLSEGIKKNMLKEFKEVEKNYSEKKDKYLSFVKEVE